MVTTERTRELLREAMTSSIPEVPSQFSDVERRFVYVPGTHRRALEPNAMLVVGARGAGKSFWWHALQVSSTRDEVLGQKTDVSVGFGEAPSPEWPNKDELDQLLKAEQKPRLIWKTVVFCKLEPERSILAKEWPERVSWVTENPSAVARVLREFDQDLASKGRSHLVLFDALDRTADDHEQRTALLRGLLELVLEFRPYASLRAKVFVRPDMLSDPQVRTFTDASKVVASAVRLDWRPVDLYALLFRYMGNADKSEAARAFRGLTGHASDIAGEWHVPARLRDDEFEQQRVFTSLAGPYMGTNRRRGKTYTWVPNHLADALQRVSPRSFLAAMRAASTHSAPSTHPLHWKGLQEGVRVASNYRVQEIEEDLPWAHAAMEILSDLVVPCAVSKITSAWRRGQLLEQGLRSAPQSLEEVLRELKEMGIFARLPDGRINIPDVYRVGFRLRRKGGLKPQA
ncbi:MAG: hypothetical protein MJD61_02650 [Proteobacteria bacterium]|nr:hypothetical protein [Pseudomonadota bacterium]